MHMPIFFAYGLHEDHDTSMEGVQMLVYVVQISRNEVKKPPTFWLPNFQFIIFITLMFSLRMFYFVTWKSEEKMLA